MKLEPHLPALPSLGELLEHPRVKGLVERINRSTLAQRASGFLEEIRGSLAERAGRFEPPSVSVLAERLRNRLLGDRPHSGLVINATGLAVGGAELALLLVDDALHTIVQVAGEYHTTASPRLDAVRELLRSLTGAEAAHVTGSYQAATMLASGVHSQSNCRVDAEPLSGLINPSAHGLASIATIAERLAAGAELVVANWRGPDRRSRMRTDPWWATPRRCGRRAASRSGLRTECCHLVAALHATLAVYREEPDAAIYRIPLWQLLSAPLANLQQRAARLAPLMAESPAVGAAEAREVESPWAQRGGDSLLAKSWAVVLKPAKTSASGLAAALRPARSLLRHASRTGSCCLTCGRYIPVGISSSSKLSTRPARLEASPPNGGFVGSRLVRFGSRKWSRHNSLWHAGGPSTILPRLGAIATMPVGQTATFE